MELFTRKKSAAGKHRHSPSSEFDPFWDESFWNSFSRFEFRSSRHQTRTFTYSLMIDRVLTSVGLKGELSDEEILPPPEPRSERATQLLEEVDKLFQAQEEQLAVLFKRQRELDISDMNDFTQLQQLVFKLHQQITLELREL